MTGKPKISLFFSILAIISSNIEQTRSRRLFPGCWDNGQLWQMKKGPTKGSGGKHRNKLKGYGPTPKAEDRVYHKAYKAKKAAERRQMADPRLAARRRVDSSLRRYFGSGVRP